MILNSICTSFVYQQGTAYIHLVVVILVGSVDGCCQDTVCKLLESKKNEEKTICMDASEDGCEYKYL